MHEASTQNDFYTLSIIAYSVHLQQPYMITAIEEMAAKDLSPQAHNTAKYLKACNKLFEEGILSHATIDSMQSKPIKNLEVGYQFFDQWRQALTQV